MTPSVAAGVSVPGACRKSNASAAVLDDLALVEGIVDTLLADFGDVMSVGQLRAVAAAAVEKFATASVRNYVPILARRFAIEEVIRQTLESEIRQVGLRRAPDRAGPESLEAPHVRAQEIGRS